MLRLQRNGILTDRRDGRPRIFASDSFSRCGPIDGGTFMSRTFCRARNGQFALQKIRAGALAVIRLCQARLACENVKDRQIDLVVANNGKLKTTNCWTRGNEILSSGVLAVHVHSLLFTKGLMLSSQLCLATR
jgi:hypothetical protein